MATNWAMYDKGVRAIGDGTDLSSTAVDRFKMALMQGPTGGNPYTPNVVTDVVWSDISTSEILSVDNGYTAGGNSLTGIQLNENLGTAKWECTSPITYTQSGANPIGPTQWVVIYDTANSDALLCYSQLTSEISLTNGSALQIIIPTTGILTVNEP